MQLKCRKEQTWEILMGVFDGVHRFHLVLFKQLLDCNENSITVSEPVQACDACHKRQNITRKSAYG
jgi:FAD synthase